MIYFSCDYNEGAHPAVMQRLSDTNLEQTPGYGNDEYCDAARELICQKCGAPDAYVQFLVGGTQTNTTVIASVLRPHQGALCADSGHINVHETGAVEATGHKVLALPSDNGKITAMQVRHAVLAHWEDANFEHIVQPGIVYISQPTEVGTLYTRQELVALHDTCQELNIPLFIDGARLGYGLMSPACDMTLQDVAALCDIFYIGGTKVGALFGEAVVITNPALQKDFRYLIKQRGAMLAKGRLLGLQFLALLENDLYFTISAEADRLAFQLRDAFLAKGWPMLIDSPTNQQFPIIPDTALAALDKKYVYDYTSRVDSTHSCVRFCTSWATTQAHVDELVADIAAL